MSFVVITALVADAPTHTVTLSERVYLVCILITQFYLSNIQNLIFDCFLKNGNIVVITVLYVHINLSK